ncbi:MAG: histidine--tRNA ligase [Candidatus Latescibacteria bacterium]|nr:histidine--tRNA ligase [Candidatus Latescibacterota bacterium]
MIQPRTLKGFRDFLPALALPREQMIDKARRVFRSYGFVPIDTPALEYSEILLGKGGDEADKQMYRFQDHGGRDIALRFDLTIPFARFAAQHLQELGTPFKRYHIGPVWRGENTQHGRYREFYQCDFDTIGTAANNADIETGLVIHDLMVALGFERFSIHVNNRRILNGLLEQLQLGAKATPVLRALDKLQKIGEEKVAQEMQESAGLAPEQAALILQVIQLKGSNSAVLDQLQSQLGNCEGALQGITDLRQLLTTFLALGIPEHRLQIDVSIARGLDYYTGTVYETLLDDLPGIGSVCSGGRYDNLAELYTKQHLPGVGASLGLDRLLAAMEELGLIATTSGNPAQILVTCFDAQASASYLGLGRRLRQAGLNAEVYPEAIGLGKQLKYADRKGFAIALIGGPDELAKGVWQVKHLREGTSTEVADADLIEYLERV